MCWASDYSDGLSIASGLLPFFLLHPNNSYPHFMCIGWTPSRKQITFTSWITEMQAFNKDYLRRCKQGLGKATEVMITPGLVAVGAIAILPLEGAKRGS